MESSLRFRGDAKTLKIHAKEKITLASNILFQAHGVLDTATGSPSYLAIVVRQFYPELSANIGIGVNFNKDDKLNYHFRAKKTLPIMESHNLFINVKGRFDIDKALKKMKPRGGIELSWSILNFQKNQDVRVKVGYDICDKVPYFQIRENNWTFNADMTGKWGMDTLLSPSSKSYYACIGESTHAYQSPSSDLKAINNRINCDRRVNGRLNFDVVSDSVVARVLGYENGASVSADDAATLNLPMKR